MSDEQQIIEEYQRGTPIMRIAESLDRGRTSVTTILKRAGVYQKGRKGAPAKFSKDQVAAAVDRYKGGESAAQVASSLGVSGSMVRKWAEKAGFVKGSCDIGDDEASKMEADHAAGLNLGDLSRKYGRTRATIRRLLLRRGVRIVLQRRRKLSEQQEHQVAAEYGAGSTMQELADIYGVAVSTIKNTLDSLHVSARAKGPAVSAIVDGRMRCAKCGEWLPLDRFHDNPAHVSGKNHSCKECARWRNIESYGLTKEQYLKLHDAQEGRCAICHRTPEEAQNTESHPNLVVDHDHETGAIRGLLCVHCNQMLGHADDNQTRLLNAANYLSHLSKAGAAQSS